MIAFLITFLLMFAAMVVWFFWLMARRTCIICGDPGEGAAMADGTPQCLKCQRELTLDAQISDGRGRGWW